MRSATLDPHGREAERPADIPGRGWRDILLRLKQQIADDNVFFIAAGVAFYAFLAIFPGIAAMVSLVGLIADPADVEDWIGAASAVLPPDALALIRDQVHTIVSTPNERLGWSLVISIALALWSATAGVKAIMTALNIAYEEREQRGFIKYYATALLLTVGAVVFALVALALVAAFPPLLKQLALPSALEKLLGFGLWFIVGGAFIVALAVLYRYAPSRAKPQWRWVSWGAVVATVLWLTGSIVFSLYVANFGDYNETYGALAAIVILLTWFYLTALVVLIGAELNAEMEHQTRVDSTEGRPKPMGARGAKMADTLGETR